MDKFPLGDFYRGCIIGDFEPNVLRTGQFEAAVKYHKKGEDYEKHVHRVVTEYNVLVSGRMLVEIGKEKHKIGPQTVFVIHPGEVVKPHFLEDSIVFVIKVPGVRKDKEVVA